MAVEHRSVAVGREPLGEESEAVADRSGGAKESGVGPPDDEPGDERSARYQPLGNPRKRVPQRRVHRRRTRLRVVDEFDPHIAHQIGSDDLGDHGVDFGLGLAWQGADVDVDGHLIGDHVGLHAAVNHVRGNRRVRAGMGVASQLQARGFVDEVPHAIRVEYFVANRRGKLHPIDESPPHVTDLRLGVMGGKALDDPGRLDERVVGAQGPTSVSGRTSDVQPHPMRTFLADVHSDLGSARGAGHDPARLGDHVVGPHRVEFVFDQMLGPVVATRLLVGHRQVDERAVGPKAGFCEVLEGHRHRRRQVQHVNRAAAPYLAVDHFAPEWVSLPAFWRDGHHVGVAHEHEGGGIGPAPFDAGHQRLPTRRRLKDLDIHAPPGGVGGQVLAQHVNAAVLVARLGPAVIDAGVADEMGQEIGDLAGQGCAVGERLRHHAMLVICTEAWLVPLVRRKDLSDLTLGGADYDTGHAPIEKESVLDNSGDGLNRRGQLGRVFDYLEHDPQEHVAAVGPLW